MAVCCIQLMFFRVKGLSRNLEIGKQIYHCDVRLVRNYLVAALANLVYCFPWMVHSATKLTFQKYRNYHICSLNGRLDKRGPDIVESCLNVLEGCRLLKTTGACGNRKFSRWAAFSHRKQRDTISLFHTGSYNCLAGLLSGWMWLAGQVGTALLYTVLVLHCSFILKILTEC